MFAAVTVICLLPGSWVAYHVNWIRQRHTRLAGADVAVNPGDAPSRLRIFGETGFSEIGCVEEADIETFKRLFPEAQVTRFEGCAW